MPDEYVRKKKGASRPINPEHTRVEAIDESEGVDYSLIVPTGTLAIAGLFMRLRPDIYIEDEEYGVSRLKSGFLKVLGTDYVIDRSGKIGSTTSMIEEFGIAGAMANSSLGFRNNG